MVLLDFVLLAVDGVLKLLASFGSALVFYRLTTHLAPAFVAKEAHPYAIGSLDRSQRALHANPFIITQPEFMRRMKEMQQTGGGGGMFGMGNMPDMYNLVVNTNNELIGEILNTKTAKKKERLVNQALDLARLSQNLLKGEELTTFIKRSFEMIK